MPYLNIDKRNVYYELEGAGSSLLFIHGVMGTHSLWEIQTSFFSKNYQVCSVDLPGHGRSEIAPEKISISTYAKMVSDIITMLDLNNPVVCGYSMGGAIGLQLALDWPSQLRTLVLVGTGAKMGVHPDILTTIRTNIKEGIDLVYDQWAFSKKTDRDLIETVKRQVLETKSQIAVADWEACDAFDCRARLEEIQLPTLVIVGEEDKLTPVWYSEYLWEQIQGSALEKIPDSGHYVMLEQPDQFNKVLHSFLKRAI